ncbi:HD-GYP domain-containing protein [Desulfobacterota bacterium M19]
MINDRRFTDFLHNDYHGHILNGDYSDTLKTHVRKAIARFIDLELMGLSAIPYIAAWHMDEAHHIWYEYSGFRLSALLQCDPRETARMLRCCIIDRCTYPPPQTEDQITPEIIDRRLLTNARWRIRGQVRQRGMAEAIYKIAPPEAAPFWLKDQATIETHNDDQICLSLGLLFVVTKEMRVEEELRQTKEELRLHRDHLESLVEQRTVELKKAQLEIVYRLARAAEFRDKWTGLHINKISRYCAVIGRGSGLSSYKNTLLFQAAPMHDIGKIGISDQILLKPGRLTNNEFKLMQTHSRIGAQLLSGYDSELLRVAKNIALTHHEKWDGSGYPRGLHGKNIPLAGRITAICDVFDALTSFRPYKKPWSFKQAVMEIKNGAGSHFDPRLIKIFLDHAPQIKEIYNFNSKR